MPQAVSAIADAIASTIDAPTEAHSIEAPAHSPPAAAVAPRSGRTAQLVVPGMIGPLVAQIEPDSGRCYAQGLTPLERQFGVRWLRENMGVTGSEFLIADEISLYNGPNGRGCIIGARGFVKRRVVSNLHTVVAALARLRSKGLLWEKPTPKCVSRYLLLPEAAYAWAVEQAAGTGENTPSRARAVSVAKTGNGGVAKTGNTNQEPLTALGDPLASSSGIPNKAARGKHGAGGASHRGASRSSVDEGVLGTFERMVLQQAPQDAGRYDLAGFMRNCRDGSIKRCGTLAECEKAWAGRIRKINGSRKKRPQAEVDALMQQAEPVAADWEAQQDAEALHEFYHGNRRP